MNTFPESQDLLESLRSPYWLNSENLMDGWVLGERMHSKATIKGGCTHLSHPKNKNVFIKCENIISTALTNI